MADSAVPAYTRKALHVALYGSMVVGVVLAFLAIRSWGEKLTAPATTGVARPTSGGRRFRAFPATVG